MGLAQPCHPGPPGSPPQQPARAEGGRASPTLYLDRCTVVSSGDAGVPVPAHVHRGVGPVLALSLQGAVGTAGIFFRLLLQTDLVQGPWGRSPPSAQRRTGLLWRVGPWEQGLPLHAQVKSRQSKTAQAHPFPRVRPGRLPLNEGQQ